VAGRAEGKATATGHLTVDIEEVVTATAKFDVTVVRSAPALRRLLADPVLGPLLSSDVWRTVANLAGAKAHG